MFVILLKYKKPIEIVDQFVAEHRNYLDTCYTNNSLFVSGPKNPRTGGVLISALTDKNAVDELIKADPYYQHDIAEYEIIEFIPVKYHKDFAKFIKK